MGFNSDSYLAYKRDTKHLLYWLLHASNNVIKSSSSRHLPDTAPRNVNTTGTITVASLVPIAELIATHISPIPSTIYRLFQSVIKARTDYHETFQQIVAKKPDAEIERSNISHKHFIDALTRAFEILGGEVWAAAQKSGTELGPDEDADEVIFANTFSTLNINDESSDGDDADDPAEEASSAPRRPRKMPAKKGKKAKKSKKGKGKAKPVKEANLDEVPLESYRIIEDESGLVTDYLMAVYSLVQQWMELRSYVQGLWHEVAYGGLNSAAAGTLSNIAISMVKQTQSAIFVDFPGHESYETVMKTITRGDPAKAQGMFSMTLHQVEPSTNEVKQVKEMHVDVKEQFLIYAYYDLLDFITDFQQSRSGKPTKSMLSQIRDWDPNFNLQNATEEQRIKWRRSYTINWLYDLVNLFSSIVIQRIKIKGQHIILETVDWSVNGPWHKHRRLFGLNEFAGAITTLAMQKPGVDIRQKILAHHVLQLQCIVDSLTVSRGWTLNTLRGHVLNPPARGFRSRRDVDLFLDRENERIGHGYCNAVDILIQFFERDAMLHGDPNRHQSQSELLKEFQDELVNFLGESKYMHGLTHIPPSRFSNTNSNGLWEYSPFLCGVGLGEALELAYGINFVIWDRMPEPMCVIHLHNMLVQRGYISQPVGLYATLEELFAKEFFAGNKVPTTDFDAAFIAVVNETGSRRATFKRRTVRRTGLQAAVDIHGLLDLNAMRFFKQKSFIALYREVDWVPDRIPDEEVRVKSALGMLRIGQTKLVTDPATGKRVLEETPLVHRAKAEGIDDERMIKMATVMQRNDQPMAQAMKTILPKDYDSSKYPEYKHGPQAKNKGISNIRELMDILKVDIVQDISGTVPLSSLNYLWVTVRFMLLFEQFEDELKSLRNPSWVLAYEKEPVMMQEKRVSLTTLALAGDDEECLEVMARMFQNPRSGFLNHIYWEDLSTGMEKSDAPQYLDEFGASCTVM